MPSHLETVGSLSPRELSSADILANVHALAPEIQSRGDEIAAFATKDLFVPETHTLASDPTPTRSAPLYGQGHWQRLFLLQHKLPHVGQKVGAVHVSVGVDGDPFRQARPAGVGIGAWIRNQILDGSIACAADAYPAASSWIESVTSLRKRQLADVRTTVARFGISDIHSVGLPVDVDSARSAELEPLGDERSVLVENLDAVVLTIANEEPAARIERQRVRDVEFPGAHPFLAPRLDELSGFVELHDSGVAARRAAAGVSVGDEDVAVRRDCDLGWRVELIVAGTGDALL